MVRHSVVQSCDVFIICKNIHALRFENQMSDKCTLKRRLTGSSFNFFFQMSLEFVYVNNLICTITNTFLITLYICLGIMLSAAVYM